MKIFKKSIVNLFLIIIVSFFKNTPGLSSDTSLKIIIESFLNNGNNPQLFHSGYAEYNISGDENAVVSILFMGTDNIFRKNESKQCKRFIKYQYSSGNNADVISKMMERFILSQGAENDPQNIFTLEYGANGNQLFTSPHVSTEEFITFGRILEMPQSKIGNIIRSRLDRNNYSFPANMVEYFKNELQLLGITVRADDKYEYDNGQRATKIVFSSADNKYEETFCIDNTRGYVCPYMSLKQIRNVFNSKGESFSQTNTLVIQSSKFFYHKDSGFWFPELYTLTNNMENIGEQTKKYQLILNTLKINQPVYEHQFSLDVPEGSSILDSRNTEKPVEYIAVKDGTVSLAAGGYDFEKLDWLVLKDSVQDYVPPTGGLSGNVRLIFIVVGVVVIFVSLYFKWKKRSLFTNSLLILITIGPYLFSATGCSKIVSFTTSEDKISNTNDISVSPSIIDFGKVRSTDSPVKTCFELCNNGPQNIFIKDIISGCGCTVIEIPKEPIPPGGKIPVSVRINVQGRYGEFNNNLIIQMTNQICLSVDIQGEIISDIWANNQKIRCSVGSEESITSATFTLYTVKYPNIIFEEATLDTGVKLKEISRHTENGETLIHFLVELNVKDKDIFTANLNIVPKDHQIAPIIIPIVCYRVKES